MPFWRPSAVTEDPELSMTAWSLHLVDGRDVHLVGITQGAGKVTRAIATFERATMVATSTSGRRYNLVGDPAPPAGDSEYVWSVWRQGYRIKEEDHVDVTAKVLEQGVDSVRL